MEGNRGHHHENFLHLLKMRAKGLPVAEDLGRMRRTLAEAFEAEAENNG